MAQYKDEYGREIRQTDEYGNPIRQTDEYGREILYFPFLNRKIQVISRKSQIFFEADFFSL